MYIFFSKIFLKRNYSTCLAFLLHGTSTFHKIFIILTTWSIGARCGRRDNLSMSTVQRENYCRDKWSVSLHWSQQNPFVSLIYLNCTFILVGSEDIFIHNFYKMSKKEKKKDFFREEKKKKRKFRVPIILVLITDKIKWFWSYNTRDYHLLFLFFFFLIAIYSSCCLLNEGKLR